MRIIEVLVLGLSLCCVLPAVTSQDNVTAVSETSSPTTTVKPVTSTTSKPGNTSCDGHHTCEECVKVEGCYFCQDGNKCLLYSIKELIPTDECKLKSINIKTCQVNLLVVISLCSVAGGLVLIALVACCCCCCRKGGRLKLSKDDLKWVRQREERKARAEEKRKERAARTLEIRNKYGLLLDASGLFKDDTPYTRFDT